MAVAAAAVARNQQPSSVAVVFPSHSLPPLFDRSDRERRRVVVDAHRNPRLVSLQIIHAVGNGLAEFVVGKIVHIDFNRLALGAIGAARVFSVSQHFFLLRIDRDGRLSATLTRQHAAIDVFKLRVAVGVLFPFPHFAIGLQTVPFPPQKLSDLRMADWKTLAMQFFGQRPRALASPAQRRHGIASRDGFDQSFQRCQQTRQFGFSCASSRAVASLPCAECRTSSFQFPDAVSHRAIGQTGGLHDRRNTAPAQGNGFCGGPPPSSALIQLVDERTILTTNPFDNICIRHGRIIAQSDYPINANSGSLLFSTALGVS